MWCAFLLAVRQVISAISPNEDFRLHQLSPNHKRMDVREVSFEEGKQEGRDFGDGL